MKKHSIAIWSLIFFLPTFIFILCPAVYVFLVDPLWQWDHPWHLTRWHRGFNERLQKTNYLASREPDIDTLIVGSSRSTYFNPELLGTEYGFNYAVSSGKPEEFAAQINYVKKKSKKPLKLIMIESSFGTAFQVKNTFEKPEYYINNAEDRAKKFRNLLSRDAYKLAEDIRKTPSYNYYLVEENKLRSYRYPVRHYANNDAKQRAIESELKSYRENVYNKPYDERFTQYLHDIHNAIGDSDYIVWTPPVSKQLMQLFCEMGKLDEYECWLRDIVNEFGKVYHFTYPNRITMDNANFNDAHHPTGATAELTLKIIMELKETGTQENTEYGGVVLTRDNIDYYIGVLKELFVEL